MTREELEKAVEFLHLKRCKDYIESSKLTVIEQIGKAFIVEPKKNFLCSRWYGFIVIAKNHDKLEELIKEVNENSKFFYKVQLDDSFLQYIDLLFRLTILSLQGQEDSEEDNVVRNSMDFIDLTEEQKTIAGVIGSNLNLLEDMLEAVHGDKWPLFKRK